MSALDTAHKAILIINSGSSSIKFSVFLKSGSKLTLQSRGQIEGIGVKPNFVAKNADGLILDRREWDKTQNLQLDFYMKFLIEWLNKNLDGAQVVAAGHRVVHGGVQFIAPVLLNDDIMTQLDLLVPLAPLHQPHNLSAIRALKKYFPHLPQVACFDTSFHASNPEVLKHFFIPRELEDEGVRRYGFHGLSYQYIAQTLTALAPDVADKKVIVAHLGSGCSMCAMDQGQSVSSSMGLTALDGLPMGTRPGALDSGVILYLLREKKMSPQAVEDLLYKKSGLLGLSQISNDMRVLETSQDPRARETIDAFVWKICQMTGHLAATTQGIDAFVFTAGIGENSPLLRKMVIDRLGWLGAEIDADLNLNKEVHLISTRQSRVKVFVIATNEELMIAEGVIEVLGN